MVFEWSIARVRDNKSLAARLPIRRGLSESEASTYIGFGISDFRQMVLDRRMPVPRVVANGKSVVRTWDVDELDACYRSLPREGEQTPDTWGDLTLGRREAKTR